MNNNPKNPTKVEFFALLHTGMKPIQINAPVYVNQMQSLELVIKIKTDLIAQI